jgi:glycosyltransferase involved in cell wall biosynthesis
MPVPQVSVVMGCYNSAATVARSIASVLAQTMADLELIIVDDASPDDTVAIVKAIPDPRIRIVRNAVNRGIGGAKNAGVEAAQGHYVAFLDSDDTWEPNKLAVQLPRLTEHSSKAPLSFTAFWIHRAGSGKTVLRRPRPTRGWLEATAAGEHVGLGSTLLASKACFDTVGPFDQALRRLEDWDWILRYFEHWNDIVFVEEPLAHVYNSGWPPTEMVERSAQALFAKHENTLRARDERLARLFGTTLRFELAVAEYRNGRLGAAARRMVELLGSDPSFAPHLARRFGRKLAYRDFS